MARRHEGMNKRVARDFTDSVDALVSAAKRGELNNLSGEPDAIRLSAALVLLDRLVTQYKTAAIGNIAIDEGVIEAEKLLLSLRSGYEHPLWTYLTGVRTKHRLHKKPPVEILRQRAYWVGCMNAMQAIKPDASRREMSRQIADTDYCRRHGISAEWVRKWPDELHEAAALDCAKDWQKHLTEARDGAACVARTAEALEYLEENADRLPRMAAAARRRPMFAKLTDKDGRIVAEVEVRSMEKT